MDRLYRAGHDAGWQTPVGQRTDWRLIRAWLAGRADVRSVLDVGCFDGRLLEFLGPGLVWKGVEIHQEAARMARARGVEVVGDDFDKLPALGVQVDAVMAVDVIEHSLDPRVFLGSLAACVRPGGYVMVTTGNTAASAWRWMGSLYWYCHIAEHVAFINPSWAQHVAPLLDLELVHVRLFSHSDTVWSLRQWMYQASLNMLARLAPDVFAWIRRSGAGGIDLERYPGLARVPPYWMSARDHLLIVLRKAAVP